jgi:Immunity protein 63
MTKLSLDEIKKNVDELAAKISAPSNLLPSYGNLKYEAHPYIEVDNLGFMFYVVSEEGQELERKMTDKLDDLLYWIFSGVTFSMAWDYERKNRIEDKDSRRMAFEKQEDLLGTLNSAWRKIKNEEHNRILISHPFDDLAGFRATYCRQLRKQGYSEAAITQIAYEKYPKT